MGKLPLKVKTQKAKIKKYYRKHDSTKPLPSQKSQHTGLKSTAHRRENYRTPSRWHLLPYTVQKIDRNPPKVIIRVECKSTVITRVECKSTFYELGVPGDNYFTQPLETTHSTFFLEQAENAEVGFPTEVAIDCRAMLYHASRTAEVPRT